MSATNDNLPNFTRVTTNVLLTEVSKQVPSSAPSLIIINAWMGAALKHVEKYTKQYTELFPGSAMIVTTNEMTDIMVRLVAEQQARIEPAVDTVRAVVESSGSGGPKILLHNFSNGGNNQSDQIATAYRARYGEPLPVTAVVMDSAPGRTSFRGAVLAFSAGLPRMKILYWLGVGLIYVVLSVLYVYRLLARREDVLDVIRKRMNDPELFNQAAPRMYIYSKKDELVGWRDVEDHAAEANKAGWTVYTTRFDDSKHVQHAHVHKDAYWRCVKEIWERGMETQSNTLRK